MCKLPAQVGLVADVADTEVAGFKLLAAKADLDAGRSVAHRVLDLQQIHGGEARHAVSFGGGRVITCLADLTGASRRLTEPPANR